MHFALLPKRSTGPLGLLEIKNALPHEVAVGALHCIKAAGDKQWSLATPDTDTGSGGSNKIKDGAGSTAHRYEVGDGTVVGQFTIFMEEFQRRI